MTGTFGPLLVGMASTSLTTTRLPFPLTLSHKGITVSDVPEPERFTLSPRVVPIVEAYLPGFLESWRNVPDWAIVQDGHHSVLEVFPLSPTGKRLILAYLQGIADTLTCTSSN